MEAYSGSLAASALVDGQEITIPGYGTLKRDYISARIDHSSKCIYPPSLQVICTNEQGDYTLLELLTNAGGSLEEAQIIQNQWLSVLQEKKALALGDLGFIELNEKDELSFIADENAVKHSYSHFKSVPLQPIPKRIIAPNAAVVTKAKPKTESSTNVKALLTYAAAACLLIVGAIWAIQFFNSSESPKDLSSGKAVVVNQDRLNKSPRDEEEVSVGSTSSDQNEEELWTNTEQEDDLNQEFDNSSENNETYAQESYDDVQDQVLTDENMVDTNHEVIIILGSFAQAQNATKLTDKLVQEDLLPYVDRTSSYTRVGVTFSLASKNQISDKLFEMQERFNPEAWVLD